MSDSNATISNIRISFFTHDDNKDHDTKVYVDVQNKIDIFLIQDIARLHGFAGDQEFGDNPPSTYTYELELVSGDIKLRELKFPITKIKVAPVGNDRWIFDYTVTITASDGTQLSSTTNGIILDQDNRTHTGIFNP